MLCALTLIGVAGMQAVPSYTRAITPAVYGRIDDIVAIVDFNGDGRQDLLVGGDRSLNSSCVNPNQRPLPPPLRVMASNGDGTFRDATSEIVVSSPGAFFNGAWPVGVAADLNNDGRPDFAVFDTGTECGAYPNHTYNGYPPVLLLSGPDGKWRTSNALADAITRIHAQRVTRYSGPNLRVLHASAGDINGDGRVDIWVESCGGENVCSHFLMNNGDGTFTSDIDRAPNVVLHNNPPEFWRHYANALVDLNDDGRLDLVLGQVRDTDPTHVNEFSLVVFNDGAGRFPLANRVLLPQPNVDQGFTAVNALTATDVDGDGRKDLILTHSGRARSVAAATGRYLQVLMNRGGGQFVDETLVRMGDQSATIPDQSTLYSRSLINAVFAMFVTDVDRDGAPDLVTRSFWPIGAEAPLVHLNNGRGQFYAMDPNIFTSGELFFGENSSPLDLNGDGIADFVHTDLLAGPDGTYGTGDEATRFIALIGQNTGGTALPAAPTGLTSSVAGAVVTLDWSAPSTGPRPTAYVIEAGSASGLANLVIFSTGSPATRYVASGVPPGTYYVRLRAVTTLGTSGPSNEISVAVR